MQPQGEAKCAINSRNAKWVIDINDGRDELNLHRSPYESVQLERLKPNTDVNLQANVGGLEILVLEGALGVSGQSYGPQTWMRFPPGITISISSREGCVFWSKRGHLTARLNAL